jgi:hypothetical protein
MIPSLAQEPQLMNPSSAHEPQLMNPSSAHEPQFILAHEPQLFLEIQLPAALVYGGENPTVTKIVVFQLELSYLLCILVIKFSAGHQWSSSSLLCTLEGFSGISQEDVTESPIYRHMFTTTR